MESRGGLVSEYSCVVSHLLKNEMGGDGEERAKQMSQMTTLIN